MSNKQRLQRRLARLHAEDQNCRYCGCVTVLMIGNRSAGSTVPNRATIEHLDDRFSPYRGKQPQGLPRTTLACWLCNNTMAQKRQAELVDLQRKKAAEGIARKMARKKGDANPMATNTMQIPAITFDDPDDVREVRIPDGHAAVRIVSGKRADRIDLDPGTYHINGVSFDDVDVPFSIIVVPMDTAKMLATSRCVAE